MSNFEIKDRRGSNKEVPALTLVPSSIESPTSTADKSSWEEVKSAIAWRPIPQRQPGPLQIIIMGRVIGLRSDGVAFVADYWFTPDYDDNRNWEEKAKERLDTFLGCDCNNYGPCAMHKMYFVQWGEQDTQRLTLAGGKPVPKVIEILHRTEMARMERAKNIAVPRG